MDPCNASICAKNCRLGWTVGDRRNMRCREGATWVLVAEIEKADKSVTFGARRTQSRCILLAASEVACKATDIKIAAGLG